MAVRGKGLATRLIVGALAGGIAAFVVVLVPLFAQRALACDPHTGAACNMGPQPTHPPQTNPPQTQPPATDPPETTPFVPASDDPPAEDFTPPGGHTTFRPSVPDPPAGPFVPVGDDGATVDPGDPYLKLGDVIPDGPQPQPAPPPPPPPDPSSAATDPLALSLAAGAGAAATTVRKSRDQDAQDKFIHQGGVATAQVIGGMVINTATGAAINAGLLSIASTAVVAPLGIAIGTGLVIMGVINFMTLPKAAPQGHAGSTRG